MHSIRMCLGGRDLTLLQKDSGLAGKLLGWYIPFMQINENNITKEVKRPESEEGSSLVSQELQTVLSGQHNPCMSVPRSRAFL